ncbi:DUF2891 family protein [Dermacoccus abyssi]
MIDAWKAENARAWANTVVEVLDTPFPWASQHASGSADDCDVTPWTLHPCFHASLDWHSSCHMQLAGITLLDEADEFVDPATREALLAHLNDRLTPANAAIEAAYLREHPGYERPYGWGWASALAVAAQRSTLPGSDSWARALESVVDAVGDLLVEWMPKLTHPVRTGQHDNTAYGLALCHDAFVALGRSGVVEAIEVSARRWFGADIDYPAHYEPSGNDFHSAALSEADLMRRVLAPDEFEAWLGLFLPRLGADDDPLLAVPEVGDHSDGKLVHLFGLNLARSAALDALAPVVERHDAERAERMRTAARHQREYAHSAIVEGDFMSTHWLVTFALRAVGAL